MEGTMDTHPRSRKFDTRFANTAKQSAWLRCYDRLKAFRAAHPSMRHRLSPYQGTTDEQISRIDAATAKRQRKAAKRLANSSIIKARVA